MGDAQPEPLEPIHARVEALEREARRAAARLDALEAALAHSAAPALQPEPEKLQPPPGAQEFQRAAGAEPGRGVVALAGRTVLALAGAYLIRALTDAGMLAPLGGVALGLVYALAWFVLADRAGARRETLSASFHGLAGAAMGYPLLWETSTRLGLVPPAMALLGLVVVCAAGSVVAARRRLAFVAWVGTLLALGTAAGLLIATHTLVESVLALVLLAALVEALTFRGVWHELRWPAALVLNGGVLILAWLGGRPEGLPEGYPPMAAGAAVAAALALSGLYVASIAARTLLLQHAVRSFDVLQGSAAIVVGFGSAARLVAAHGGSGVGLGIGAIGLGAACYTVAFAFVERRAGSTPNFYFYSSAGGLLTLLGSHAILATSAQALLWCLLAVSGSWLGRRLDRTTLRYHGTGYLWAAGLASGLLACASRALLWSPPEGLPLPTAAGFVTATTALVCVSVLGGDRKPRGWRRIPHGLVAGFTTWVAAGILVAGLAHAAGGAGSQPAIVATLRTAVLATLAVVLADLSRRHSLAEAAWLVYLILAIGGLKLVLEDVPAGRPITLFVSFVIYGAALLAAPRVLRTKAS
jgi:hypothetical protein